MANNKEKTSNHNKDSQALSKKEDTTSIDISKEAEVKDTDISKVENEKVEQAANIEVTEEVKTEDTEKETEASEAKEAAPKEATEASETNNDALAKADEIIEKTNNSIEDIEKTLDEKINAIETKYKRMRLIVMILVAAFFIVSIGYVSYTKYVASQNPTDSSIIASNTSKKEQKDYTEKIVKAVEGARDKNAFIAVQDGENTGVVIVYNKKGEAFAQSSDSSYITIYRDDHKAVRYTEYVDFGYDSDVLSILENVATMTKNGKTTVLKDNLPNKDGFKSYIVDIKTWDGVLEMYSMFDPDFGSIMVEQLKTSLLTDENNTMTDQINFRFVYLLDTDGNLAAAECYVYFGDKASDTITMKELGLSWKFDGIKEISDWELDAEWYSKDWDTLSEWTDISKAEELLTKQYGVISKIIEEYFPKTEDSTSTPDSDTASSPDTASSETTSDNSSVSSEVTTDTTTSASTDTSTNVGEVTSENTSSSSSTAN